MGAENINCEYERLDGYLFVPPRESQKILDDELEAAHKAGLVDIEKVERVPWDSYDTGPALRFPRQAQFHPLHYLMGWPRPSRKRAGESTRKRTRKKSKAASRRAWKQTAAGS